MFTPFLGGGSHHEAAKIIFDIYQRVLVSTTRGIVGRIFLFRIPECLHILFKLDLSGAFSVYRTVAFIYTFVASNVIHISPGSLLLLFSVAFIVPSFYALRKHDMVADPVGLIISIIIITRLMVQ